MAVEYRPSGSAEDHEAGSIGAAGEWTVRPAAPAADPLTVICQCQVRVHLVQTFPVICRRRFLQSGTSDPYEEYTGLRRPIHTNFTARMVS